MAGGVWRGGDGPVARQNPRDLAELSFALKQGYPVLAMSWIESMAAGRTTIALALVVALAVALLPVAGGAVVKAASASMSMSMTMSDCCPDMAADTTMPCDKTAADCPFMAVCNAMSFSILGTTTAEPIYLLPSMGIAPFPAVIVLNSRSGSPPLRPPQA